MNTPRWPLGAAMPEIGPDVDALVLVFSREETEGLRVGRGADDLMTVVDDERLRRQLTHSLFFAFEGWGDDPREVHEIPACRRYLQALHAQFPYWLHFLAPIPDMWGALLLCLLEPDGDSVTLMPGSNRRARSCDPDAVNQLLRGMVRPLQLLHEHMALTREQGEAVLEESLAAIRRTMSL